MEESKNPSLSQSELTQLETLIERLHKLFIASLDPKAFDLYIEPQVKDRETGVEYSAFTRLTDFITDPNAASLLLAGDPGMGKTLLSLQIAQHAWYLFIRENLGGLLRTDNPYWQEVLDQSKAIEFKKDKDNQKSFKAEHCLPLWLWMPFLRSKFNWREELLETHFKQIRLLPTEVQLLKKVCQLKVCRLLPIMDGWDELPPGVVIENLYLKNRFWEETGWPYLKVFSTCRPEAFIHYEKNQRDYRSIFDPKQGAAGSYTILNLSPFEPRHVKDYVERYLSMLPPDYTPSISEVSDPAVEQGHFDKAKQAWLEDYQKYTIDPAVLKQPLPSIEKERKVVEAGQPPVKSQKILQNSSQPKSSSSQSKPQDLTDSKKEIIAVPGDSHCAFYAIGIGLIENIYDGSLQLNTTQHSIFLRIFGQSVLKLDRDASVDELKDWIQKNYITRYEFRTYQILKEPLRLLASTLLQEKWKEGSLPRKLCDELVAMAKQAKDTKTNQLDVENFKAIFLASHLKEGEFGKALKTKLDEMTDLVGSQTWENNLFVWLSESKIGDLYRSGVTKNLWASREIELPLFGHYFGISIYVDNKPIYQAKNPAEIGLVMQHGIHYDYQTKLSRLTAQRSAVLEMIEMGRGKINPILEKKLKDLDQAIANIKAAQMIFLKQEELEESDEEKVDEEDFLDKESRSKKILSISPKPQSSQSDNRFPEEPVENRVIRDVHEDSGILSATQSVPVVEIYAKSNVDWRNLDTYLRYLEQIRGLSELVKTPFILSAVVQVLPTIMLHEQRNQNSDISRYMIYQYFVDHWLTKQAARLWSDGEKRRLLPEFLAENDEASIAKLKACLLTYSENLARLALNLGKGKINVDLTEQDTLDPSLLIPSHGQPLYFKKEVVEKNKIQLMRSGCLLKNLDNHFKFLHKSLVEYFVNKTLFNVNSLSLNDRLLTTEPSVIYLLADKAKEDIHFKNFLYQIIELSKGEPYLSDAAANAITILNAAGESFSGRDFRRVNIRGAILNGALCDHTDFEGADLRNVTAQHAFLTDANLSHSQTHGLNFQESRIKHANYITAVCVAPNDQWLLVGDVKGYVTQYSYLKGKQLQKWHRRPFNVPARSLALHPDGKLAAWGMFDGSIQLIHIQENRLGARFFPEPLKLGLIEQNYSESCSITFCSKADRYLAFSSKIWVRYKSVSGYSDGEYQGNHLQIWDIFKKRFLGEYKSKRSVNALANCNKGEILLAGDGKKIAIFSMVQYNGGDLVPVETLDYDSHFVLSQDGHLLALAQANAIQLYQTHDWAPLNIISWKDKRKRVSALALSHNKNLLAVRLETQLHFWDISSGKHLYVLPIPEEKIDKLNSAVVSLPLYFVHVADDFRVLFSVEDTLYFWPLNSGSKRINYMQYPINFSTIFLERTEFSYAIHTDTLSIKTEIIDKKRTEFYVLSTDILWREIYEGRTKYILVIYDKIAQKTKYLSYQNFKVSVWPQLALSMNQAYLVTRSEEIESKTEYGVIKLGPLGLDTEIRVWDLKLGRLCWTASHPIPCSNIIFSMDSQWLIHGSKEVFIHQLEDGKQLLWLTTGHFVTALALSADKSWLAVADEGSLSLFDVKTQQRLHHLPGLSIIIRNLDVTKDSKFLVAKGKKEGTLTFRIFQEHSGTSLKLIHRSMALNLACTGVKIEGTRGLSKDNLQLLQQNNAQGTPVPPSQENHLDEKERSLLPRKFTFDRALIQRASVRSLLSLGTALDYNSWQVGLVRYPNLRAFIIVEGMDAFSRCFFWRFDLVIVQKEKEIKERFAQVVIKKQESILLSEREAALSHFLNPRELKGRGVESLVGHIWQLKREVVLQLYCDVQKDAAPQKALTYSLVGNQGFFGRRDDNSHSWAHQRLLALKQKEIEKQLSSKMENYLGIVSSWNLTEPLQEQPAVTRPGFIK